MAETLYRGNLLPERPALPDVMSVLPDYRAMLLAVMAAIADRYKREPDYPFIDTKLDLITGEDFPPDDPVRGANAVYGWIQGRGLEFPGRTLPMDAPSQSGAETAAPTGEDYVGRARGTARYSRRNAGHLSFFMSPDGTRSRWDEEGGIRTLEFREESSYGFSDLFSAQRHGCRGEIPRVTGCRSGSHGILPPRGQCHFSRAGSPPTRFHWIR